MTPHYAIKAALHCATDLARCEVESITMAQMSERGTLPDSADDPHAFADWNDKRSCDPGGFHGYGTHAGQRIDTTMSRLMNILEHMEIECEWADEWTSCDECCRMVRSSPDGFDWKQFGYIDELDGSFLCGHCISAEDYIESRIDNPESAVDDDLIDLAELGFTRLDPEYENGMHPGQNDDPAKILETLQNDHPGSEFLFTYEPSQFYTAFTAWHRDRETGEEEAAQ